jgi:N utilization substance protein A
MFLVKLFEVEVPEIADGTIEVKAAAREPGYRAKIAVMSTDRDIDPVGACVGMKGSRVQNIVNELQGEKIDIVRWNEDSETFARAALAPAEIQSVSLNHADHTLDVIVEDDQLSLAIGKRGQNVRLAAMLTGWKINIISKAKLQERVKLAVENLVQLSNISEAIAQVLVQKGVMSIIDLSASTPENIARYLGKSVADAQTMIDTAAAALEDENIKSDLDENAEIISASAVPNQTGFKRSERAESTTNSRKEAGGDKFSEVERRLREELAAFKLK